MDDRIQIEIQQEQLIQSLGRLGHFIFNLVDSIIRVVLSAIDVRYPAVLEDSIVLTDSINVKWYLLGLQPDRASNDLPLNWLFEI